MRLGSARSLAGHRPQVLAEFIHIVTDARRFQKPLLGEEAIAKTRFWWNAAEVRHVFPTDDSTRRALDWLQRHQLGRKRILDTQLTATLWSAGIQRLVASNPADFRLLGFEALVPQPWRCVGGLAHDTGVRADGGARLRRRYGDKVREAWKKGRNRGGGTQTQPRR